MVNNVKHLYHLTTIDGLYSILNTGYIESRKSTGVDSVLSPKQHIPSSKYIYLSFNSKSPNIGKISIQLVLSFDLLKDRNDYFLNYDWKYGKSDKSLSPNKLDEYLGNYKPEYSEIIFENSIPINPYLIKINVIQMKKSTSDLIPKNNQLPIVDLNKIPIKYKSMINIIEK